MPIYDYECMRCGTVGEYVTRIDINQECPKCGQEMKRLPTGRFGINMGAAGAYGYYDETLGKYISTNRERRAEMERQGVTEKGATPKHGQSWV